MRSSFAVIALSGILVACGSDNNATGPDARNCTKGSISGAGTQTGSLLGNACQRFDYWYSEDSTFYWSYDVKVDSGKGYLFNLQNNPATTNWDNTLELVGGDASGNEVLLAISDDEGPMSFAQLYFVSPVTATLSLRVSGYSQSDTTAAYTLQSWIQSSVTNIKDTVTAQNEQLSTTDFVLEEPAFTFDSAHTRLFTVHMDPNEFKTITVSATTFDPGFNVWGPAFGIPCDYDYEGCGGGVAYSVEDDRVGGGTGGVAQGTVGSTVHFSIASDGFFGTNPWSHSFFGYNNFPGQYTVAVGGSTLSQVGNFTLTVQPTSFGSIVAGLVPPLSLRPITHLARKPVMPHPHLSRTAGPGNRQQQ